APAGRVAAAPPRAGPPPPGGRGRRPRAPPPPRGQTVVDRRPRPGEAELHGEAREQPLVDVALDIDPDRYVKLYLATVEGATASGARDTP
ncbi:nucleoside hydrolase, partial [Streptomyces spiralis]